MHHQLGDVLELLQFVNDLWGGRNICGATAVLSALLQPKNPIA